jgi:hypothetical protein
VLRFCNAASGENMKKMLIVLAFVPLLAYAGTSVVVSWNEVVFKDFKIGESYDLNKESKIPFSVINNQPNRVTATIKAVKPEPKQLKTGYEAIPEISWVTLDNGSITVNGRNKELVGIRVAIPDEGKYIGKKYSFFLVVNAGSVLARSTVLMTIKE